MKVESQVDDANDVEGLLFVGLLFVFLGVLAYVFLALGLFPPRSGFSHGVESYAALHMLGGEHSLRKSGKLPGKWCVLWIPAAVPVVFGQPGLSLILGLLAFGWILYAICRKNTSQK